MGRAEDVGSHFLQRKKGMFAGVAAVWAMLFTRPGLVVASTLIPIAARARNNSGMPMEGDTVHIP